MTQPPDQQPLAAAMEWAGRIFAISLEMVLPGLAGQWLDQKLGTSFLALVGFALGISMALWHLLVMAKASNKPYKRRKTDTRNSDSGPGDNPPSN